MFPDAVAILIAPVTAVDDPHTNVRSLS